MTKLGLPPRWLLYLFLAITGGLMLYPTWIGSVTSLVPLVAANVIFLVWDGLARRNG